MAKRKTKAKAVKRQANKVEGRTNLVLEYEGWKASDRCYTVFGGESKPSLCDIIEFHPGDDVTPSVSLTEVATGKYRVAAIMAISDSGPGAKKLRPEWDTWYTKYKEAKHALMMKEFAERRARKEAAQKKNDDDSVTNVTDPDE